MAASGDCRVEIRNGTEIPLRNPEQHWKEIFNNYDTDHDGRISIMELNTFIESREYKHDIPEHVVKKIHTMHDRNNDQHLDFKEFVAMINDPQLEPLFGRYVKMYMKCLLPKQHPREGVSQIDGLYEDEYKCCPPPVGMIIISLVEIVFWSIDAASGSNSNATGPVASTLLYDPHRRYEMWRYITYMFVHIGILHLVVNLCVQILLGTPLEMVHRWWRVLLVYFSGVIAGSLATSVTDPSVKLAGASGGVYSLITAHISTIIMNWSEMEYPLVQMLIFLIITICDVGTAIYDRYVLDINEHIGYAAHFAGAVAGLLVGLNVLRNLEETKAERFLKWASIIAYGVLMGIMIVWNVGYKNYFPDPIY